MKSSQDGRDEALEGCNDFLADEMKAMGLSGDAVADKGVVHVISKSIDRVSGQIEARGAELSVGDQATRDSLLSGALDTFASDAYTALGENSLKKYDQALKALHGAVTLAWMHRDR